MLIPVHVHRVEEGRALALQRAIERQRRWLLTSCNVDDPLQPEATRRPSLPRRVAAPAGDEQPPFPADYSTASAPCLADVASATASPSQQQSATAASWLDASADDCWVEYFEGTSPLILASPHDGRLEPRWAVRRGSSVVTVRDKGATAIACSVALHLAAASQAAAQAAPAEAGGAGVERTGASYPHVLLCHVSRAIVDVNRTQADGASCPRGRAVHTAYHALLSRALASARRAHAGRELFVDFHTQAHFKLNGGRDLVELGYLLPLSALSLPAELLDGRGAARSRGSAGEQEERCHSRENDGSHCAERGERGVDSAEVPAGVERATLSLSSTAGANAEALRRSCSLCRLWQNHEDAAAAAGLPAPAFSFSSLLRGERSLGELLRARGIDAVPRADLPAVDDAAAASAAARQGAPSLVDAPEAAQTCAEEEEDTTQAKKHDVSAGLAGCGDAVNLPVHPSAAPRRLSQNTHPNADGANRPNGQAARPISRAPAPQPARSVQPLHARFELRRYFCGRLSFTLRRVVSGSDERVGAGAAGEQPACEGVDEPRSSLSDPGSELSSNKGGTGIDGVQLELPIRLSANAFHWERLSRGIAGALSEWHDLNYAGLRLDAAASSQ